MAINANAIRTITIGQLTDWLKEGAVIPEELFSMAIGYYLIEFMFFSSFYLFPYIPFLQQIIISVFPTSIK
jgi:hypothetical protein